MKYINIFTYYIFITILFIFCCDNKIFAFQDVWPKKMFVTVSIANVRHEPKDYTLSRDKLDWYQTTQLLFGEK